MSKLAQSLKLHQLNRVAEMPTCQTLTISSKVSPITVSPNIGAIEYSLSSLFGTSFIFNPYVDNSLLRVQEYARNAIINEIFGEFRSPLIQLRTAINMSDRSTANTILDKIFESMYNG